MPLVLVTICVLERPKMRSGFMSVLRCALVVGLVFFKAVPSWGWGNAGHRMVARIAMEVLILQGEFEAAAEIEAILNSDAEGNPLGSKIAMEHVATYADEMRADPRFDVIRNLHFANIPADINRYEDVVTRNPDGDVVEAIEALDQYIRTNDSTAFKTVPALDKFNGTVKIDAKLALTLFIHFVGDTFQPLHLGYPEDLGGNKLKVLFGGFKHANFHEVWDSLLFEQEGYSYTEGATAYLAQMTTTQLKEYAHTDIRRAINETLEKRAGLYQFPDNPVPAPAPAAEAPAPAPEAPVASFAGAPSTAAPAGPPPPLVDYKYILNNTPLMREQILKGGVMLAELLKQNMKARIEMKKTVAAKSFAAPSCKDVYASK